MENCGLMYPTLSFLRLWNPTTMLFFFLSCVSPQGPDILEFSRQLLPGTSRRWRGSSSPHTAQCWGTAYQRWKLWPQPSHCTTQPHLWPAQTIQPKGEWASRAAGIGGSDAVDMSCVYCLFRDVFLMKNHWLLAIFPIQITCQIQVSGLVGVKLARQRFQVLPGEQKSRFLQYLFSCS